MKYSERIGLSKKGTLDPDKVVKFFIDVVGLVLTPVNGQRDSYWFSGVIFDGFEQDLVDGPKYYKLVFDGYGVTVNCNGMLNAFQMRHSLADWIADGVEVYKAAQKKVAKKAA